MTSHYRNWLVPALIMLVWICGSTIATPYAFAQSTKWLSPTTSAVAWSVANYYVGRTVPIQGTIVYVNYTSSSGTTFLGFSYPYQGYFSVVVPASDAGKFKCLITGFYLNKEVRITGKIQLYNGAPEIIVHSPYQIEVAYQGFPCA